MPEISNRITEARQRFPPTMICAHLRRGDFLRVRPDVVWNTRAACNALDRLLVKAPDANIFLCTDDGAVDQETGKVQYEGVREIFQQRYGERVISTSPRSLDRRTPESVQDALVDLWLLRSTHMIVGTEGSSFSYLTVLDRDVDFIWTKGQSTTFAILHWITLLTGINWLVRYLYYLHRGQKRPFAVGWNHLLKILKLRPHARRPGNQR